MLVFYKLDFKSVVSVSAPRIRWSVGNGCFLMRTECPPTTHVRGKIKSMLLELYVQDKKKQYS